MDFALSEDQRSARDLAARLLAGFDDDAIAAFEASGVPWAAELHRELGSAGLLALVVDEAAGGLGLGWTALATALAEQGRRLAPVPFWQSAVTAQALAAGAPLLVETWLANLLAGRRVVAVATPDLTGPLPMARARGNSWTVTGRWHAVEFGDAADGWLLPAMTETGTRLLLVPAGTAGVTVVSGQLTHHLAAADLQFDDVVIDGAAMLEPGVDGAWLAARASLCLAALQLGVSDEALARTATHVSTREQFGRPIGTFQSVATRVADAWIDIEALRSHVWQLGFLLDRGDDAAGAAAAAKWWACQVAHRVGHSAQHLHGGLGADISYPIHRYYLWSRALEMMLGGAGSQLASLGDWLAETRDIGVLA